MPAAWATHRKSDARLLALSRAHDTLTRENWVSADILELTRDAAALYESHDGQRFTLQGDSCRLDPRRALALSMALHELCTNALKHGALSLPAGNVLVSWERSTRGEQELLELIWREAGGAGAATHAQGVRHASSGAWLEARPRGRS